MRFSDFHGGMRVRVHPESRSPMANATGEVVAMKNPNAADSAGTITVLFDEIWFGKKRWDCHPAALLHETPEAVRGPIVAGGYSLDDAQRLWDAWTEAGAYGRDGRSNIANMMVALNKVFPR